MAAARAQEAPQSSRCTYDVFLSFRGADTRKTFTDGLYTALVAAGFRTFRDDDEIERGEHIKSELERAILQSRGSILVVSRNYATSGWCLDELVTILRHKRENGHAVLPIFYHVEPSQVRNQTGSFGKAISTHEKDKEKNWKVEGWRAALREVADMGGMPLRDQGYGHELKFIEKVVKVIEDKVNRSILSIAPYLIGIDSRVKNITPWLQSRSDDVGVLAICGMGGIGKTTIAKYVFDLNFERFECSSFLENIRELSKKANGLVRMQRQLLSDIQVGRKVKIGSVAEGIIKIKDALRLKQALLVLDDVNEVEQLDAVLGMRDCFFPGSKIIVTTRNTQLMKDYGVQKIHNVENMLDDESTELFSWHAFGKYHPSEDYVEISNSVVDHCGGLPLALQVLGSALFGKSVDVWESTLKKLEAIAHSQVVEKLKISYDSLQDEHDRRLFLEITCFFVRKKIEHVITILDECDLFASIGIQNLIDRCLLKVNENNELVMHHLLRDMGREIVRQESPKEPGKRSRLWRPRDSFSVLREKTGSDKVEGLSLEMNLLTEEGPSGTLYIENSARKRHPRCFHESNSSKRRRLGLFSWLPSNIVSTDSFSASNEVTFDTDALSSMRKLRFLQFKNVQLRGGYQQFPCELIWLRWRGFPHKSIPDDFPLNSLVSLELRHSSLEQNWKGTKFLVLLKILNLSHSHVLTTTPDFSQVPNLERLILKGCINLTEVDESIGKLRRIVLLNLEDCTSLKKLPTTMSHLNSLEKLIVSGCSNLSDLSMGTGKMQSLRVFHADRTSIINQSLPSSINGVRSWWRRSPFWSWVRRREAPQPIPFSLACFSRSLLSLRLANCNLTTDDISGGISSLSLLQELTLSGNPIQTLPETIKGLTMLQSLTLEHCRELQSLPELPASLTDLTVHNCNSLEKLTNLPNLQESLNLIILKCDRVGEVEGLFRLEPIGNFDYAMKSLLGLFDLGCLEDIEVSLYNNLTLTRRKVSVQGLHEFGIFSTCVPGTRIPGRFTNMSTCSEICFRLETLPHLKIKGLNVCVVYTKAKTKADNPRVKFWDELYIRVTNKTKGLKWIYSPTYNGIPDTGENMTWLSHWKIGGQLGGGGNELIISVFLCSYVELKEFGAHVVYDEEEDGDEIVNLSVYQVGRDAYFLCHYDFDIQQKCNEVDDGWNTEGWYEFLFGDSDCTELKPRN